MNVFLEGIVKYPEYLPCPQVDTDLTPRERRYISDIGEVKKFRRFQRPYQATRQKISFIFTSEEAKEFSEWYKNEIIEGGAWFYADWPILHKEQKITYRFVTRPVWKFLARQNYHVSATVELYEGRKVGIAAKVFTSKIYPYYFVDDIKATDITAKASPTTSFVDNIVASSITIAGAVMSGYIYRDYTFADDITLTPITIPEANLIRYTYLDAMFGDDVSASPITISKAEIRARRINYTYFEDAMTASHITIVAGELT